MESGEKGATVGVMVPRRRLHRHHVCGGERAGGVAVLGNLQERAKTQSHSFCDCNDLIWKALS